MTATTSTAGKTQTVTGAGWEMHLTNTLVNSDKFWRGLVVGDTFVSHYGRRGSDGQVSVKRFGCAAAAIAFCKSKTAEKDRKGYVLVREATGFEIPAANVALAGSSNYVKDDGSPAHAKRIVDAWLATAAPRIPAGNVR